MIYTKNQGKNYRSACIFQLQYIRANHNFCSDDILFSYLSFAKRKNNVNLLTILIMVKNNLNKGFILPNLTEEK